MHSRRIDGKCRHFYKCLSLRVPPVLLSSGIPDSISLCTTENHERINLLKTHTRIKIVTSPAGGGNAVRVTEAKPGLWEKIGAGSLSIAVLLHIVLLIIGAFWIFQIVREPEKKVDFMPAGGGGGGGGAQYKMQQKRQAQITPSTSVKRVFAEGAQAAFAIPEQSDTFGEMASLTTLSTLSGGGMSGGLGGSGGGSGIGKGPGSGSGSGFGHGAGAGFGTGAGRMFMSNIGGMKVEANRLAVALDASGSVKEYQAAMQEYIEKTFKRSEVASFKSAGFNQDKGKGVSMGDVVLEFLKSSKKFDAIYIFSDFGETRDEQTQWKEIEELAKSQKVRLYLHVLREKGKEEKINPVLAEIIKFAKRSGGDVKTGPMKSVEEKEKEKL